MLDDHREVRSMQFRKLRLGLSASQVSRVLKICRISRLWKRILNHRKKGRDQLRKLPKGLTFSEVAERIGTTNRGATRRWCLEFGYKGTR